MAFAPGLDPSRLVTFENFSGSAGGNVWPATSGMGLLFAQGLLLPAYTITGFDASAHAAEETIRCSRKCAARNSAIGPCIRCCRLAAAGRGCVGCSRRPPGGGSRRAGIPRDFDRRVAPAAVGWIRRRDCCGPVSVRTCHSNLGVKNGVCILHDGGLPWSRAIRWVCPKRRSPPVAIWGVAAASSLFTLYTPIYATITAVCTIFLYVSYVVPGALGAWAHGKSWTIMGPWDLGVWYRPLAVMSTAGCAGLIVIGMQPPNQKSVWVVGGCGLVLAVVWFSLAQHVSRAHRLRKSIRTKEMIDAIVRYLVTETGVMTAELREIDEQKSHPEDESVPSPSQSLLEFARARTPRGS